jgi:uncharacterized DUF497 family protein
LTIREIIILPQILDKLRWKHQVSETEVRQMFLNEPKFRYIEKGKVRNEDMYSALGRTDSGRYLITFFIHKLNYNALIITSRDMTNSERKLYEKK